MKFPASRVLCLLLLASSCSSGSDDDSSPPLAAITFPPAISATDASSITVTGTASDPDGVSQADVNGVLATTTDGFAHWQATVPLVPGSNLLTVATLDMSGDVDSNAAQAEIVTKAILGVPSGTCADVALAGLLITDSGFGAVVAVGLTSGDTTVLSGAARGTDPALTAPVGIALDGIRALVTDQDLGAVVRGRIHVSADALALYAAAIEKGFGGAVDYARVVKS